MNSIRGRVIVGMYGLDLLLDTREHVVDLSIFTTLHNDSKIP